MIHHNPIRFHLGYQILELPWKYVVQNRAIRDEKRYLTMWGNSLGSALVPPTINLLAVILHSDLLTRSIVGFNIGALNTLNTLLPYSWHSKFFKNKYFKLAFWTKNKFKQLWSLNRRIFGEDDWLTLIVCASRLSSQHTIGTEYWKPQFSGNSRRIISCNADVQLLSSLHVPLAPVDCKTHWSPLKKKYQLTCIKSIK